MPTVNLTPNMPQQVPSLRRWTLVNKNENNGNYSITAKNGTVQGPYTIIPPNPATSTTGSDGPYTFSTTNTGNGKPLELTY